MRERFKVTKKGYKFDRRIFLISTLLALLVFFIVLIEIKSFGAIYISCPEDSVGGKCFNPFYEQDDLFKKNKYKDYAFLSEREYLISGESLGKEPSDFASSSSQLIIFIFMLSFFSNHFIHNSGGKRGKSKKIKKN
jgi:hypothetical protein